MEQKVDADVVPEEEEVGDQPPPLPLLGDELEGQVPDQIVTIFYCGKGRSAYNWNSVTISK